MSTREYRNILCSSIKRKISVSLANKANGIILHVEIIHIDVNVKGLNEIYYR